MRALILVDIQNDFMPDGALPVPDGYAIIPIANKLAGRFDLVVATQDWHPADHGSFASNHDSAPGEVIDLDGLQQVLWPDHCVQHTRGAEFVSALVVEPDKVFRKGTDPRIDSYSGFYDNGHRKGTGLTLFLRSRGVDHVYVVGVATDYCVKFTMLDALRDGFAATLVIDGCRGVDLEDGDSAAAIEAMRKAGANIINSTEVS